MPGGQKSQFGAPVAPASTAQTQAQPAPAPVVHNHYNTYHVNAMDVQSFNDFAKRNHVAIGDAVAKNLQNAHGSLTAEVQRAANP